MTKLCLAALLVAGCAADLKPNNQSDAGTDGGPQPRVVTTMNASGTSTSQVRATELGEWIGFDFETGTDVPDTSTTWDLRFQRFHITVNGGLTGPGMVEVAVLPGVDFATVTRAPVGGYGTDGDSTDWVFDRGDHWYAYTVGTHVLMPRDVVYVVRSVERNYYKMKFVGYYDSAGTSGYPKFEWARIEAPPADDAFAVDTSGGGTVYVNVTSGGVVATPADPATSRTWDLAFKGTEIATNSGSSAGGFGGARLAPSVVAYGAITSSTTLGFVRDGVLPLVAGGTSSRNPALDGWFDEAGGVVTPKPGSFLVRTATGNYGKLQVASYSAGRYMVRVAPVLRDLTETSATLDARAAGAFAYYSLTAGQVVTPADAATSTAWDLGFSRTLVRTNGGSSGPGMGAAADPMAMLLGGVVTADGAAYMVDVVQAARPPATGSGSGSPVLADWFDYVAATQTVTPKVMAFLVRTADGGHVKLRVTSWTDGGQIGFDFVYAGAGRTDFF